MKSRRPTISPNINFVGQLAEFDRQLKRERREPSLQPIIFRWVAGTVVATCDDALIENNNIKSKIIIC